MDRKPKAKEPKALRPTDCWYEGMEHMTLYRELIRRAPTMHGTPGAPNKRHGGK